MLELQNVSFQVPGDSSGQKEIIKSINLKFQDHTFTAITGPNGGGKSTWPSLLWALKSLLQEGFCFRAWTSRKWT